MLAHPDFKRKAMFMGDGNDDDDDEDDEDDDDDDDDTDYEEDSAQISAAISDTVHSGTSSRKRKPAITVREHSKKQRDKRKAGQRVLEAVAKKLSDEHVALQSNVESKFEMIRVQREKYAVVVSTLLDLLYGDMCSFSEDEDARWMSILEEKFEITIPKFSFSFGNPQIVKNEQEELRNIVDVLSAVTRVASVWRAFARLGANVTDRLIIAATLLPNVHVSEGKTCFSGFALTSTNAVLCGGKQELILRGMIMVEFGHSDKIKSASIVYNESDLHSQLKDIFGEEAVIMAYLQDVFLPCTPESSSATTARVLCHNSSRCMISNVGKKLYLLGSDEATSSVVPSSLDTGSCVLWPLDKDETGNTSDIISKLGNGQVCTVDSILIKRGENVLLALKKDLGSIEPSTFIQAIPIYSSTPSSLPDPQYALWVLRKCRESYLPFPVVIISDFILRLLQKYVPLLGIPASFPGIETLLSAELSTPFYMLHSLLKKAYTDLLIQGNDINVIQYTKRFIKWISHLEKRVKRTEAFSGQKKIEDDPHIERLESVVSCRNSDISGNTVDIHAATLKTTSFEDQQQRLLHLQQQQKMYQQRILPQPSTNTSSNISLSSTVLEIGRTSTAPPVATMDVIVDPHSTLHESKIQDHLDIQHVRSLDLDTNEFFTQIRRSGLIPKFVSTLQLAKSTDEQRPLEQFLWFCWSKHPSKLVQDYMQAAKSFIEQKRFEEAYIVLTEVMVINKNIFYNCI